MRNEDLFDYLTGCEAMDLPTGTADLGLVLVLALPGIVYAAVRARALGTRGIEASISGRIAQGLVAAVVIDLIYLCIFGSKLLDYVRPDVNLAASEVRQAAGAILLLGVGVPAASSWILNRGFRWARPNGGPLARDVERIITHGDRLRAAREAIFGSLEPRFGRELSAWDFSAPTMGGLLMRIRTTQGVYIGGLFDADSYVSTYPEPRDVYIARECRMSASGEFMYEMEGGEGLWYAIQPGDIVEWIRQEPEGE